jgi:hypothetical protein
MTRYLAVLALALPGTVAAQTPAVYTGAEAVAATVRLCTAGCTITPNARPVRAVTPFRPVAEPADAHGIEALARRQLDALIAAVD